MSYAEMCETTVAGLQKFLQTLEADIIVLRALFGNAKYTVSNECDEAIQQAWQRYIAIIDEELRQKTASCKLAETVIAALIPEAGYSQCVLMEAGSGELGGPTRLNSSVAITPERVSRYLACEHNYDTADGDSYIRLAQADVVDLDIWEEENCDM